MMAVSRRKHGSVQRDMSEFTAIDRYLLDRTCLSRRAKVQFKAESIGQSSQAFIAWRRTPFKVLKRRGLSLSKRTHAELGLRKAKLSASRFNLRVKVGRYPRHGVKIHHATVDDLRQARVALVTERRSEIIDPKYWHQVRPRPGVRIVIRILAGKNALRSILSIVIAVAAFAVGQVWGAGFGAALFGGTTAASTAVGTALLTTGVTILGNMLLNALIPPPKPDSRDVANTYAISGWQNRLEPGGAVPVLLGRMRYSPPFAAFTHSEIVGDDQYIRALFCFGEGPVVISDLRIGETLISEYRNVDVEIREGRASDLPQTIIPRQIAEEAVGIDLTRPLPRDSKGEVIEGQPTEDTPVVRTTGADAKGASVILTFPAGMIRFDDKGGQHPWRVDVRIEQRPIDGEAWQTVTTLNIRAKKLETFYRQHAWNFPTRGRWQIRLTMLTSETTDTRIQNRTTWPRFRRCDRNIR